MVVCEFSFLICKCLFKPFFLMFFTLFKRRPIYIFFLQLFSHFSHTFERSCSYIEVTLNFFVDVLLYVFFCFGGGFRTCFFCRRIIVELKPCVKVCKVCIYILFEIYMSMYFF